MPERQAIRQHPWPVAPAPQPLREDPDHHIDVEHRVGAHRTMPLDGQAPAAQRAVLQRLLQALHLAHGAVHDAADDVDAVLLQLLKVLLRVG